MASFFFYSDGQLKLMTLLSDRKKILIMASTLNVDYQEGKSMTNVHITPNQAANYLGVTLDTLSKWRSRKIGPAYYKVGRRVQYLIADLEDWRERQKVITKR